jgi:hypothetical protein
MWARAFLVLALVLSGGLPPPSRSAPGGGGGVRIAAAQQITDTGDAFAVECVRCGATMRARVRAQRCCSVHARAFAAHAMLRRIDATQTRRCARCDVAARCTAPLAAASRRRSLAARTASTRHSPHADLMRLASALRSAEQQFNLPVSQFDQFQFRQTIALYFQARRVTRSWSVALHRMKRRQGADARAAAD